MDGFGLANPARFEEVVARHPQVERIVCGHLHRASHARFSGTLASTCPGTAHQVTLDLRRGAPLTFVLEPPGYQLHRWDGVRLVTHTAFVGDFDGPHPFHHT